MRRLRNLRDRLVENHSADDLGELVYQNLDDIYDYFEKSGVKNRLIAHWKSNNPYRREIVYRLLRKKGIDLSNVHAAVYERRLDEIAKIENLIGGYCRPI